MADDYDKIAELVNNGYTLPDALNQVEQTVDTSPSATTTVEGLVTLATPAEVTTGTTSKVPPVSALVAHEGICKAWVSFDGTGTVAINDDYNVSSITDEGDGSYTVNLVTDMANTDYAIAVGGEIFHIRTPSASLAVGSFLVETLDSSHTLADYVYISAAVFGDQ
jgi:hypothetical protein